MPRADLLALTLEDLAALTNRGTVRRAERELSELQCEIKEAADGTVAFAWSDGVSCKLPAGKVVAQGICSCPATELCRHLVRSVLAYQREKAAADVTPAAPHTWNPGDLNDEELAKHFKAAARTRLKDRFEAGLLVELVRGPKPSAYFHEPPCLLRFLVPGDPRYTHCDCAETAPCSHVPLAVWAFRRLDPAAASGMVDTQTRPLPIPTATLDDAEQALLEWSEVGLAGASSAWKDRLTRLERRCRDDGLIWPAEVLADFLQQYDRYVQRDALFQPLRIPELIGEFLIRADAIRRPTGAVPQLFVRGSASDQPLEIGSARYVGLGCDAELGKRSVELSAYLQDVDSGSVVAVTRSFVDAEGEEPRPLARLAETPVVKGVHFRQLGVGQLLIQGGKRNSDHRLVLGRAKAHVNPQNFSWEKLRASLLAENFGEVQARLALLPPSALRPRRVADHLFVCPIARAEEATFDPAIQCVLARLIDASGGSAYLEHPYASRAADGTELLLGRLTTAPEAVRFVAGVMRTGGNGLTIRPTCVVFQETETRGAVQPWVDRAPTASAAAAARAAPAAAGVDAPADYLRQVQQQLAELFVSGLARADGGALRSVADLARVGEALGFARAHTPLRRLAQHLRDKARRTDWDGRGAARELLFQAVIVRMGVEWCGR